MRSVAFYTIVWSLTFDCDCENLHLVREKINFTVTERLRFRDSAERLVSKYVSTNFTGPFQRLGVLMFGHLDGGSTIFVSDPVGIRVREIAM
jgi:hypothetical protein